MTQPSNIAAETADLTFEKINKSRYQVLLDGKPIGVVVNSAANWWAHDLNGDKVGGGHATARLAAAQLPVPADEDDEQGIEIETPTADEQLALDGGVALTAEDWAVVKEVVQLAWKAGLTSHAQEAVLSAMTVAPLKVS